MSETHIPPSDPTLDSLRQAIDQVDGRLHDLLMERAKLVLKVGEVKGRDPTAHYYRPEREARIHRRLEKRHKGPLPVAAVHRIFREIISASLNLEKPLTIAYLGPEATHTHQAAMKHFGSSCRMVGARTIDEVFDAVEAGQADYGVTPLENASEGVVCHTLDRFVDSPLRICAEVSLPMVHNLLSRARRLREVRTVYGHYQALEESRSWLAKHLPEARLKEVASTARAVALAQRSKEGAALAGVYAADLSGLHLLAEHVESRAASESRFLAVGPAHHAPGPSGGDKTSLLLALGDQPGALHQVLGVFARRGINLSWIESHPLRRRPWKDLFFIDLQGHDKEERLKQALDELSAIPGIFHKILGSYPVRAL